MAEPRRIPRRTFLGAAGVTVALVGACKKKPDAAAESETRKGTMPLPSPPAHAMPRRPLGRTGVTVSIVGLGGYHIGVPKDEAESIRLVRSAIDRGIDSSTTAGTTTTARARSGWGRRSSTDTASGRSR